jgi:ParB family chromosome partitioning protein
MAQEAEQLLSGTNWLPEPLRTPGHPLSVLGEASPDRVDAGDAAAVEQSAAIESESAIDQTTPRDDADQASVDGPQGIAAE